MCKLVIFAYNIIGCEGWHGLDVSLPVYKLDTVTRSPQSHLNVIISRLTNEKHLFLSHFASMTLTWP